jgi:arylformamidase
MLRRIRYDLGVQSGWIDISVPLAAGITQWPGDPLFACAKVASLEAGDEANVTSISLCAHTGTHIDAPLHYFDGGAPMDALPLEALIGPATVTRLQLLPASKGVERVLLRTQGSPGDWWRKPFREDYDCVSPDQARALVAAGVRLVGIDYLSIGGAETHRILLEAGVIILEGLNLSEVETGAYELICLPLLLEGADGAPARAVIRPVA